MLVKNLFSIVFISGLASAADLPEWWPRIAAEDTTGLLKECTKRQASDALPNNGQACSRFPKICFFGTQECPGVGPHPVTKCVCDGLFAVGATQTWSCADEPCPPAVPTTATNPPTSPPVETTSPPVPEATTEGTSATTQATPETTQATSATSEATEATEATSAATEATSEATSDTTQATEATEATSEATSEATPDTTQGTEATSEATEATSEATPDTTQGTEATSEATPDTTQATSSTTQATPDTSQATPETTEGIPETTAVVPTPAPFLLTAPPAQPTAPTPCPPAVPNTGDACPINGRTCTYTATASNVTTECVDTDSCRCGTNIWACAPTVTQCTELPPPECPPEVPVSSESCLRSGVTCTYQESFANNTNVCETDTACTCDGTSFSCAAPSTSCTVRPPRECPPTPPTGAGMSCPEVGFQCTYTTGSQNTTSICNTTEVCACGSSLFYECAVPTTTCIDGPSFSCPSEPTPGQTCDAPGLACDYTIVNQNATTKCNVTQTCTCGVDGAVTCADPVESCEEGTLEACPASLPSGGDTCGTTGLQCGYISQTSNATNVCNTTTTCTCGDGGFGCAAPVVECRAREVGTCPDVKPSTGDTCGADVGCTYSGTVTNATASCNTEETCTCTGGIVTCGTPTVSCSPIETPTCPNGVPAGGTACTPNGLQCTYTIPSANQTDFCTRVEVCGCSGGQFGCTTQSNECVPAPESCPVSRPESGATCGTDGLECTYMSSLRNDTSTCAITTMCTCDGTAYGCVQTNVQCEDSAPLTCPATIPTGSPSCDVRGLSCTYTVPTGGPCNDETVCNCGGASLIFTCGATTTVCPP